MSKKPLIHLIAGARPNFMKIAPIIRELQKHKDKFNYQLIHTGQHYDKAMSDVFFDELGIPEPDFNLEVGSATHAYQTAEIMKKYEDVCQVTKPDLVLVVGDVNSTLACSIVAKKQNIKVAHVEAGLRSGDMTMPEEVNRIVTDAITDYYFVTEKSGVDNLLAEGKKKENIYFVGHVMIDNLFYQLNKLKSISPDDLYTTKIKNKYNKYGVVTLHRPSNVDNKKTLEDIISALSEISQNLPLIFPVHPRTRNKLNEFNITIPDTIELMEPLPYMEFLHLFKDAAVVLTDSGGIQEETTALGIPCITLRDNTERPITIEQGTNQVVGTDEEKIVAAGEKAINEGAAINSIPELWDGAASVRICEVLSRLYSRCLEIES